MPISVTIPTLGKPKTVKDAIISILSREWPLTARKLYNNVRKNHGLNVTYQAVHKVLVEMLEDGIITRKGMEYSLNSGWIKNSKEFYGRLETRIEGASSPSNEEIFSRDLTMLEFDNLYECYSKVLEFSRYIAVVPHYKTNIMVAPVAAKLYHMYWILAATKEQNEGLRYIMKTSPNSHFICKCDTSTDRLFAKYFESLGAKVKTGVECADTYDILAGGGFVIQIFFTAKLKKELDRLYDNFGKISKADIIELYNRIYSKKTRIHVIIIRNCELEKQIFEDVKRYFKR